MPVGTLEHSPLSILQVLSRMGGSMVANTQSGRNRYQQIAAYPPLRITMSSSDKEVLADNSLSCHGSWLNIKMWAIYDWPKCTIERKGGRVRYLIPLMSQVMKLRGALKERFLQGLQKTFFWRLSQYSPVHVRTTVSKPWNRWGGGGWWDGMGHLVTSVHVILSSHENIHILNFLVKYLQTRFIFHKKLDIFPTDVNPRYLLHFECLRLFCCWEKCCR